MRRLISLGLLGLVLPACGDGQGGRAPDADVGTDAGDRGMVRVRVIAPSNGIIANLPVYFQAGDSSLILATTTDGSGAASAAVPPGSFVTVVTGMVDFGFRLWTYTDVQPGDELAVDFTPVLLDDGFVTLPSFRLNQTLEFDFQAPPENVAGYELRTECGTFVLQAGKAYAPSCPQFTNLLVIAYQQTSEGFTVPIGYQYEAMHDIVNVKDVVFTQPFRPFDLSTVSVTNVDSDFIEVGMSQRLVHGNRVLWNASQGESDFGDRTVVGRFSLPRPAGETLYTTVGDGFGTAPHVYDWRPSAEDVAVDLEVPHVRVATSQAAYDATRTQIRWTEESLGVPGNLARGVLNWNLGGGLPYQWEILSPRGEEPLIRVPRLPRAELVPGADTSAGVQSILDEANVETTRRQLLGRWTPSGYWPPTGARGRITWRDVPFFFEE